MQVLKKNDESVRNVLRLFFLIRSFNREMINENKSHPLTRRNKSPNPFISLLCTGERTLKSHTIAASESRHLYCCRRQHSSSFGEAIFAKSGNAGVAGAQQYILECRFRKCWLSAVHSSSFRLIEANISLPFLFCSPPGILDEEEVI